MSTEEGHGHRDVTAPESAHLGSTPAGQHIVNEQFSAFYRQNIEMLVGFLINQGSTLTDASDIAQTTMIKVFQRWSEIEHHKAWAYTVASRELIRKLSDVRESPVDQLPESSSLQPETDGVAEWEARHDALRLLSFLPPRQRQIMSWTLSGFTPGEIAEQLGLSSETVRGNLKKARRAATELVRGWEKE
ncbi:sigma-70 family RNA polymerase sigma factor [Streptomyces alfalfae]|uniref:sigma-70 family RNA polymerase sigma factor n=1 Tax=Streptomyces alfalfae TaxID=1642299 RepID=UPI001BA9933C|nr:sigma-70 family RNA polymerase sigma factor [Streptomyces alfalfae]QUI29459.1 sigma-70 family RNA polymerase sigma factor [Streptomyces alfalfae]